MIRSFRHKGLRRLFEKGSVKGVQPDHAERLRLILGLLDAARGPKDLGAPALKLHLLNPKKGGRYAVQVSGNWRVTFKFEDENAEQVDYEDYHKK